jgi:hypothetical protein
MIDLQREMEEMARQPETKLGAIAQTRHIIKHMTITRAAGRTSMRGLARPSAEVV